jgi:integrase
MPQREDECPVEFSLRQNGWRRGRGVRDGNRGAGRLRFSVCLFRAGIWLTVNRPILAWQRPKAARYFFFSRDSQGEEVLLRRVRNHPAGVLDGYVFRPVNRGDQVQGTVLSEKVVWQMLRPYATTAGVPGIAPHDARRSCAKFCQAAGAELEQIQLLLGHASVQTTERYLGTKQDLVHAPNDGIKLRV